MPLVPLLEHKNADFVLGKPENEGSEGQKRTKTPILCSRSLKMGVTKGKSAQKPRFCARKARKRGFQTPKAHKNLDFVLEKAENVGFEGQKRTKTSILCSKCPKTGVPEAKSAQKCRFCARKARKRGVRRQKAHKNLDFVLGRKFRYGFETCADCSFKASCEKLAPFMENEVARKNMNL